MNLEAKATKGITGSLKGVLKFPVVLRVLLPGALAVVLALPLVVPTAKVNLLKYAAIEPSNTLGHYVFFALLAFVIGIPISALNDFFLKLYQGRIFWSYWLFDQFTQRQRERVRKLKNKAEDAKAANRGEKYNDFWFELRAYPEDDSGLPCATHPTLLGNILAGYEEYPLVRYGMDPVFFWPRIWLELDQEKKEEIDVTWSAADSLVNLSGVALLGFTTWAFTNLVVFISELLGYTSPYYKIPLHSQSLSWFGVAGLLFLAWIFYRLSLSHHRKNGEMFKSIFDLYRDKIGNLLVIGPEEKRKWRDVWLYLQYGFVACSNPQCSEEYRAKIEKCPACERPTTQNLKHLAGKLRPGEDMDDANSLSLSGELRISLSRGDKNEE